MKSSFKHLTILLGLVLVMSSHSFGQKKISSSMIKGYWMIENDKNQFFDSDTLIFYKRKNEDKSIEKHHGKRPFVESEAIIKRGDSRVNFNLSRTSRAICSEITFPESPEFGHIKEWMWGKWKFESKVLEIKSEHHYHWKFKVLSIEEIEFEWEGKKYSTVKMVAIKRKFENYD